jgi:NADP-dependent 3-hydroxy acid dehydrogenase YdfG
MRILITGHTRGIGLATVQKLLQQPHVSVLGIARTQWPYQANQLQQWQCDLSNVVEVQKLCNKLKQEHFDAVILNAGANDIRPADAYNADEIQHITQLNFNTPLQIIRACLPHLISNGGCIIALGSFSALEVGRMNNYYGAAKAGLQHFMKNLFEQYRKQQLRVTTIVPDIVNSNFYDHQAYAPSAIESESIQVQEIADCIYHLLFAPQKMVTTEMIVRPQRFALHRKG